MVASQKDEAVIVTEVEPSGLFFVYFIGVAAILLFTITWMKRGEERLFLAVCWPVVLVAIILMVWSTARDIINEMREERREGS